MDSQDSESKDVSIYDSTDPEAGSFPEWVDSVDRITSVQIQIDRDPNHKPDPNAKPATFEFLVRTAHESNAGFMRNVLSDKDQVPFAQFFVIRGVQPVADLFPVIEETIQSEGWLTHRVEMDQDTPMVEVMKTMRAAEGEKPLVSIGFFEAYDEVFVIGILVDEAISILGERMTRVVESWA